MTAGRVYYSDDDFLWGYVVKEIDNGADCLDSKEEALKSVKQEHEEWLARSLKELVKLNKNSRNIPGQNYALFKKYLPPSNN